MLLLIGAWLHINCGFGQSLLFEHIAREDGLPTNEVYDIYEARDGQLYIATDNGFAVYNGSKFTAINTKKGEVISCTEINEDEHGNIFTLSFDGRIFRVRYDHLEPILNFQNKAMNYPSYEIAGDVLWSEYNGSLITYHIKHETIDTIPLNIAPLNDEEYIRSKVISASDEIVIFYQNTRLFLYDVLESRIDLLLDGVSAAPIPMHVNNDLYLACSKTRFFTMVCVFAQAVLTFRCIKRIRDPT